MRAPCIRHGDPAGPAPLISRGPPTRPTDPPTWCGKELAHIRCGHLDADRGEGSMHHGRRETEAESVAHLVCRVLGLDTQTYSDAYVLGWADGDLDLVQACADKVIKVARGILDDLTPAPDPAND